MIGKILKLKDQQNSFECLSEPYVAFDHRNNFSRTYVMVADIKTSEVLEINVAQIKKIVREIGPDTAWQPFV